MAAQEPSTTAETASSPLAAQDDETITVSRAQGGEKDEQRAGDEVARERKEEVGEGDERPQLAETGRDEQGFREAMDQAVESEPRMEDSSDDIKDSNQASQTTTEATQHTSQVDTSTSPSAPAKDEAGTSTLPEGPREPTPSMETLKPNPIHASSTINRTASPAYSQSSITSGQGKDSVASPSLVSTAPKKFSTVNINKKFLGKSGTAGSAPSGPSSGPMGNKESGLGLVNLSARPSPTLAQQQSASRILTSAKLTSVIPSKPSSATGGLAAAPVAGWAKPAVAASAKGTPVVVNGALSPRTGTPVSGAVKPSEGAAAGTALATRTPSTQTSSLPGTTPMPSSAAPTGIRLTNQGPSATRHLTSLHSVKQPVKRGWQTMSPNPESQDPGHRESSSSNVGGSGAHGPFGQARFKQSLADDFPTAMEVIEGQRSAVVQAQQAAQAKAAHNQAILEGLNAFRGTNKDPNAHGWDEEDDEDMDFPQVLDFGDGTTYTLPVPTSREQENKQPQLGETQQTQEQPVSKEERFATDDFDRSWPPKAPHGYTNQEKHRSSEHQHTHEQFGSTRTLYNARLNKMEPSHERPAPASAEPSRTQILPRSTKEGTSTAQAAAPRAEKQPGQHPLERQTSRDRPWARVQPPVIGAERNPWGRRRPSETEHNRTWGPPHPMGESQAWPRANDQNARSPPMHQAQLAPLFSQTQSISAVLSPPPAAPMPINPAIDITELQKDEMHRAAEQARLRRQQEEAEREAQKERARKKAEEIAAREAQRAHLKTSVENQAPTSIVGSHVRKEEETTLQTPKPSVPRIGASHQPAPKILPALGFRRPSEKRVAFEEPVSQTVVPRIESSQRPSVPASGPVSTTPDARRDPDVSKAANVPARSPVSVVSPNNQHFSAFFDPLAESDHLPPTELHYNDLSSLTSEGKSAQSPEARKLVISGPADRFNLRPELLQAESWRKSTRGQEVIVPGVIGSSREQRAPQKVLLQKPFPPPVPDTLQTMEELVWSPPTQLRIVLPPLQQAEFFPQDATVGSAFDTVLARLQNAMSTSNEQHQSRAPIDTETDSNISSQSPPVTDLAEARIESDIRLSYSALPRPEDFIFSTIPLPPSPGPAWKRYTIRLPRDPALEKPYPARGQNNRSRAAVPPGWILSWDPPLEQLGPRNLSRDDWLMPKSYHRGKLVTAVKLPFGKFQPYRRPQGDVRPGEASAVTSQALKDDAQKSGPKKIVVRLPPGNFRGRGVNGDASDITETQPVREEFQTSSDIPLLSPMSSLEDLPSAAAADAHAHDAASGRRAARKVPEGVAIAFARPHGSSFSEDADAKSSVRFMVSSEIEDDNLLSEVNKMSMDGLTDNPAAEESQGLGLETEPHAPSTPSAVPRAAAGTRSGPPSPSLATNSAWTSSGTYPVAQSPGRKLANRDHVMNVWTNMDGDRGSKQQTNALRHPEGDVSTGQLSSLQDVSDDAGSGEQQASRNEIDLDLDLPRYPTINAAPIRGESTEHNSEGTGQQVADGANDQPSSANVSHGYDGYQYMAINHMAPSSHIPSPYTSRSPLDGLGSNTLGNMSAAQHGVWMPLQQAASGPYSSGMSAAGSPIYGAHSMSKSPVSSGYDGTPVISSAGLSLGPMPSMGTSSGGMYSHPSGPLDSPTVPYIRPSGYTSQPSHLGGMPAMYNPAGPYANSSREMYGNAQQYGHRGNMGQSMLSAGNQEYGGRFNNSMAMNRPFGGFNGGSAGPVGGSRYNPSMNGFAQSNLQGSQQQRIGLSGQGKVGPNAGRKVW